MLDLGQFIARVKSTDPLMAQNFILIERAINQLGIVTGTDSTGFIGQPQAPGAITVKAAGTGEAVHVTLTDHSTRGRQRNYFIEWSPNDANFTAPHIEHLGVSRGRTLNLATFLDDGITTQSYYFRGYSMDPGSEVASAKVTWPGPVTLNGTTALTYLPSQGAGTAPTDAGRPGQGYGTQQTFQRTVGIAKRGILK